MGLVEALNKDIVETLTSSSSGMFVWSLAWSTFAFFIAALRLKSGHTALNRGLLI